MPGGGFYNSRLKKNRRKRSIDQLHREARAIMNIASKVNRLREDLDQMKTPKGGRDNPVRTCRDLLSCKENRNNGRFF